MIGAANAPPRPWARTSASCCRECTASRPWPNGGCFPPTKARCTSSTCLVTWTSSASGSTVAAHAAAVWSSTGCSNWPSATTQSVTSSSLRAPSRRRSGRPLPETEATLLAWTAPAPDDPGATRPDEAKSAQMDSPDLANLRSFYRWAKRWEYRDDDPTLRLDSPRVDPGLPRPITNADLHKALDLMPSDLRRAVCLGAYAGLRISEVAALDWANVDLL